jgi:hypothetical protein
VAAETIPGERMERLWQFANSLQLSVQRFSIRLNDLGPSVEARPADRGGQILSGRPGAKGQVVA